MAALSTEIPKLTSINWMEFKSGMEMLFMGAQADYLIDASASTTIPPECVKLDKQLVFYLWARVDDDHKFLVQDSRTSALKAWLALLTHFGKSTMPRRLAARQHLYSVEHDTSKPIDVFIHSVTSAAKALADLGSKVEDTEIKDILLMRLDDSYASIRTSIMTAKEEPDLSSIKSLLSSASSSIPQPSSIAAAQVASVRPSSRPSSRPLPPRSTFSPSDSPAQSLPPDDRGFFWCDTTNSQACHRCGRPNHIAAFCLFTMPQYVKDWVMKGGYREHSSLANSSEDFQYEGATLGIGDGLDLPDHFKSVIHC
ncbi:hypothetical protein M422DRAFT_40110 [Sphaerobolus stellatus SS14]|uniref:CCHC-type domain-containing protein n=1 Tax=Sphaerobolus stellatus (strain SS14) TaxID=990650 RepID=A0A0C9TK99_SPHS4|nr:hypothetical protein M422DRAFT_40110 [Sphaerobolus stellatus SS14]